LKPQSRDLPGVRSASDLQTYFFELSESLKRQIRANEIFTCRFWAEDSDFVRFNRSEVRQALHVTQRSLRLQLIDGRRHASGELSLSQSQPEDRARVSSLLVRLRDTVEHLPEDPYLMVATEVRSSERAIENALPPVSEPVGQILTAARGCDLVGVYAGGGIFSGFANSLGQRNWFATYSHNMDWSLYHAQDKAVKCAYAGFAWDEQAFAARMSAARDQLSLLGRTPRTIEPGHYRVYFAPAAVYEIMGTVAWGGFGMKDHRTKQTSLLKMVEAEAQLGKDIHLIENTRDGVAANFQAEGFIKPDNVTLIEAGRYRDCLTSPRSAREFGVEPNGAGEEEYPESLDMRGGPLSEEQVLEQIGRGLYVNNLWYLNYSDRPECRITGMTRFATFWVEKGRIVAPVNVMRFDDTLYRMLGEHLIALTRERDFILDAHSYGMRATTSGRMPGALVEDLALTL